MERTIYLDNAATTFPKPAEVIADMTSVMRYSCGNPGRSSHKIAMRAAEKVYECREKLADCFGSSPEHVVFTSSATHSLNLAIKTTLRRGDHVLISDIEHNSVIRPIVTLAEKGLISYDIYVAHSDPEKQIAELNSRIRPCTAMICACHHSNICNLVLPIREMGAFCKRHGVIFLVDASQSAGILPINLEKDGIDLLCAPGHKGLYGPPGCGFAVFGQRFDNPAELPDTFTEGGNGIRSKEPLMPDFLPERLEAGTLAVPLLAGLSKGIDFVRGFPKGMLYKNEARLCSFMRKELSRISGIRIYGEHDGSILLFSADGISAEGFAEALDTYGICVRSGFHCAPTAHEKLGTPDDGAVRVSFGAFNTEKDVSRFCTCAESIVRRLRK